MDPKFALFEHFSGSCNSLCNQSNLAAPLKAACDLGSQSYCAGDNAFLPECQTHTDRVVRTLASQKTSIPYSNPITVPSGSKQNVNDYYLSLVDNVSKRTADIASKEYSRLASADISALVGIFKAESTTEKTGYNSILDKTEKAFIDRGSPLDKLKTGSWIGERIDSSIAKKIQKWKTATASDILADMLFDIKHMNVFADWYNPAIELLVSKLTTADLRNPLLYDITHPTLVRMIDKYIIEFVTGKTISLDSKDLYNTDLSMSPRLYDSNVYGAFKIIATKRASNYPLLLLFAAANNANYKYCSTLIDPRSDPLYVAMKSAGEKTPEVQYNLYCADQSKFGLDECTTYYQSQIAAAVNPDSLYSKIVQLSTDANGVVSKTSLDKYSGLQAWLKTKIQDQVVMNGDIPVITSVCGAAGNLSVAQCGQLCALYPDMCVDDQVQKCRLPTYRYAQKESFSGKDESWFLYILLALIVLIASGFLFKHLSSSPGRGVFTKLKYSHR